MRQLLLSSAMLAAVILPAAAQPEARFETNLGNFTVLLEDQKAPATVKNFIRYAKQGHFNNTQFYRIVPGFVIQAGAMGADGKWRQNAKPIPLETKTGLANIRGTIAMARDEKPATAQAEYFINLADDNARALDAKELDAPNTTGYAVFGHVTSGMAVVDAIAAAPIGGGQGPFPANYPLSKIVIKKVTIGEAVPQPPPADPSVPPAAAAATPTPATPASAPAATPPSQ
jgi:Peptidyl-prolyl cis-trans isomerase (rotamase) - cyclophilin family